MSNTKDTIVKAPGGDPVHVCFAAPTVFPYYNRQGVGGAELQMVNLAQCLSQRGNKVTVFTNDYGQPDVVEYQPNLTIRKVPLRFLGGSNRYFIGDTLRYAKALRELNPDIVFMKIPNSLLISLAFAKIFCTAKVIKIFASDDDYRAMPGLLGMGIRWGQRRTDGFVFQTRHQQENFRCFDKIPKTLIRNLFIPPPDDRADNFAEKNIDVLWVGAMNADKKPESLLALAQSMPDCRFTVISKYTDAAYGEIDRQLKELPNVVCEGKVPYDLIHDYFRRAKILLCTSVVEGFPNTFLQAWHAHCAVISVEFNCDGILEEYRCGLLSGTLPQAKADIERVLTDSVIRQHLVENGLEYLNRNHCSNSIVNQYLDFIRQVCVGR